jgi:hypothetical protein
MGHGDGRLALRALRSLDHLLAYSGCSGKLTRFPAQEPASLPDLTTCDHGATEMRGSPA